MAKVQEIENPYVVLRESFIPVVSEYFLDQRGSLGDIWEGVTMGQLIEHRITSPPDQLFFAEWQSNEYIYVPVSPSYARVRLSLYPQFRLESYFIDFAVFPFDLFLSNPVLSFSQPTLQKLEKILPKYAIEIDGKYHESDYDQIEYDKQRERVITSQGFSVVRFTAREVFRDVSKCVDQMQRIIAPHLAAPLAKIRETIKAQDIDF